jgi:hypothetical protein
MISTVPCWSGEKRTGFQDPLRRQKIPQSKYEKYVLSGLMLKISTVILYMKKIRLKPTYLGTQGTGVGNPGQGISLSGSQLLSYSH